MASLPKTQYAKSGDLHVACQVTGSGPLDLVWIPGFVSHLESTWEHPWPRRFRGREIDTAGGGFFAAFDGPARAIRCAEAIAAGVQPLGVRVRAGLHTGEGDVIGDKVGGIAVHIGARFARLAGPGEVLVSGTVRDLVAGSGIRFEERGTHTLKGVPGEWRLFAVSSPA